MLQEGIITNMLLYPSDPPPLPSRLSPGWTHVAQGGTPLPWGSQDSASSSGGHSAPSPTGNWVTCLIRVRFPLGNSGSRQVLEHGPHSAHSVTWQSFGSKQDWTVGGKSLGMHKLGNEPEKQKKYKNDVDLLINIIQAVHYTSGCLLGGSGCWLELLVIPFITLRHQMVLGYTGVVQCAADCDIKYSTDSWDA